MNAKRRQFYEEIAKQKGKTLLIESCSISTNNPTVKLLEKVSLIEDTTGKQYSAVGVIKGVPISKYTENANGRIYSRTLWEEVKKKKMGEGSLCMADHPEDDKDSIKDIYGVWHNMELHEDMVTMDLYLVEEKPLKVLKIGGAIGTSSVGYGNLNESDGKTVDPYTFELQRAADLVVNPSQGTYATYEHIQELTQTKDNILTESRTNNIVEDIKKENFDEDNTKRNNKMLDKLTEASLKNQVRIAIKEAKASPKMKDAIEDLKGIKDTIPSELVESHSKLDEAISEITQKLEEQLIDAGKVLKEKESTLEEMTVKYQTTEKAYNELKKNFETVSALVEKMKSGFDRKAVELVESLQKDRKLMEADISMFTEEIEKRDKDIAIFQSDRKVMESDIAKFEKLTKKLKESLGTCKMNLKKKSKVKEDEEFADIGSTGDAEPIDLDLPEPDEDVIDIDIDNVGGEYDIESDIESVDSLGLDELDAEGLIEEAEDDDKEDKKDDDDEKEMKEEDEDDEKEDDEEEMKEEDESEEDEVTEFSDEDKKEKKEESKKTVKALRSVVKYYKEQVKKDASVKDIKKHILTAKSLFEASKLVEKFKESRKEKESLISLKESDIRIPKMSEYKFTR